MNRYTAMRLLIFTFSFIFIFNFSSAQNTKETPRKKVLTNSRDRISMSIFTDQWYKNSSDSIKNKWYSRGIEMHVCLDKPIGKSRFSISPGIGFGVNNYYTNAYISKDTSGATLLNPIAESIDFRKNKISALYAEAPIELRFRTKPDLNGNSFKLGMGIKVGYALATHSKYRGKDYTGATSDNLYRKDIIVPNITTFKYGLTARLGYSIFNITAYYGLSPLFKVNRGPEIYQFQIGFGVNGF